MYRQPSKEVIDSFRAKPAPEDQGKFSFWASAEGPDEYESKTPPFHTSARRLDPPTDPRSPPGKSTHPSSTSKTIPTAPPVVTGKRSAAGHSASASTLSGARASASSASVSGPKASASTASVSGASASTSSTSVSGASASGTRSRDRPIEELMGGGSISYSFEPDGSYMLKYDPTKEGSPLCSVYKTSKLIALLNTPTLDLPELRPNARFSSPEINTLTWIGHAINANKDLLDVKIHGQWDQVLAEVMYKMFVAIVGPFTKRNRIGIQSKMQAYAYT